MWQLNFGWRRKPPPPPPPRIMNCLISTSVFCYYAFFAVLFFAVAESSKVTSVQHQQTRAIPPSPNTLGGTICPLSCECDTPGVVSCISAKLTRLPLRLPTATKFFYAEHNRFGTPVLSQRNFTNYIGPSGRSSLVGMSLHNCSLTLIGYKTFSALKSLQELDLSNNKISVIEDNTFNGLNLNMLDLSYNVGIQFSKQAFCGCTIRRLALRAVGLKTFDLGTFSFIFPNLMSLSVADNRLLTIDYRLFSCAPNLSTVYFARNPWWCGGDCSTLQLINHVNRHSSDLVLDEAPTCQPGYEEQQDLNKAECTTKIALINKRNNTLPECPITITTPPQSFGRSLANPSDAPTLANNNKQEEEFASVNGGFVTWNNGIVANYTRPVTLPPGLGAAKAGDVVLITPSSGGCYKLSTVVAASTMASVATLVIVLSTCLCARACYLRYRNREQPSSQTPHHVYHPPQPHKNGNFNNNGHHKNGGTTATNNGNGTNGEYKPLTSRNGSGQQGAGGGVSIVPSQGQPLLRSGSESSGSGHLNNNGTARHNNRITVS